MVEPILEDKWLEAQNGVLGSVLLEPDLAPKVIAQTSPEDYFGTNQTVFKAIKKLFLEGKPVDIISVAAALGSEYRQYIVQLMEITPTAAHLDNYIALVHAEAKVSKARELGAQITKQSSWDRMIPLLDHMSRLTVDRQ